jgi:hypothetical protein
MLTDPLIAAVEIPADAQVSIIEYKFDPNKWERYTFEIFKTDKLILGQPISLYKEFFSDVYISNLPANYYGRYCGMSGAQSIVMYLMNRRDHLVDTNFRLTQEKIFSNKN